MFTAYVIVTITAIAAIAFFSRGSSSDGLPSAVNISARRVVAMAAIIGDAHGGRQGINDTCTHGQRVRARPIRDHSG
jgi:hypothetical protein